MRCLCYRLRIILAKRFISLWRSHFFTAFIIIIPLLLPFAFIYLRNITPRDIVPSSTEWDSFKPNFWPTPPCESKSWWIAYAPNSSIADDVMKSVGDTLNLELLTFDSEDSLMVFMLGGDTRIDCTLGAIIIDATSKTFSYTIRLKSDNYWFTDALYEKFSQQSPRTMDIHGSPPDYYNSGFLTLQYVIDRSVTINVCGNDSIPNIQVNLKRMPFPPFTKDNFFSFTQSQLSFIIVLGFMFPTLACVRQILVEKQSRIKETLKMLGLSNGEYWISWFFTYITLFSMICIFLTFLLCVSISHHGPILRSSNPFLIFCLLLLYAISLLSFAFALSAFFDSPQSGTALICAILIIIYLPFMILDQHYHDLSLLAKLSTSLVPSLGMGFICTMIGQMEGTGLGVQFTSLFKPINPGDSLCLHMLCMVMLGQSVFCLLFTLYVDTVWPGQYGVPKPWHFFITHLWRRKPTVSLLVDPEDMILDGTFPSDDDNLTFNALSGGENEITPLILPAEQVTRSVSDFNMPASESSFAQKCYRRSSGCFEAEPFSLPVGIAVRRLRKVYTSRHAKNVVVSDLSMNIYKGQITILLGHNGAGKTTTLSMLTGLFPPTEGRAYVNGYDISTDIEGVRRSLGFCPQHDVFFSSLTVEEHLRLFAKLKGCSSSELETQVMSILNRIHLTHKRAEYASALSGGMQRRLSIGMALIGDSQVLILDEPTSGLDPEARRQIWDILMQERASRTILVTTHYMDEADHLGDRIAIMAKGRLQCFGSPLFLKAQYGAGYLLSVIKQPDCAPEHLLTWVRNTIPEAQGRASQGEEVKFLLPLDSTDRFSSLFTALERDASSMGVISFGISLTTMEEVFFRVSEQLEAYQEKSQRMTDNPIDNNRSEDLEIDEASTVYRESVYSDFDDSMNVDSFYMYGEPTNVKDKVLRLYWKQFSALLVKRGIYLIRHRILLLSQFLIPITLTVLALVIFRQLSTLRENSGSRLQLSLDPYIPAGTGFDYSAAPVVTYSSDDDDHFTQAYAEQFNSEKVVTRRVNTTSYKEYLLEIANASLFEYQTRYIIGLTANASRGDEYPTSALAYFQGQAYHAAPVSLNTFNNGFLRFLAYRHSSHPSECPGLEPPGEPPQLRAYNHPLPPTSLEYAARLNSADGLGTRLAAGFPLASNLLLALSYLAASFGLALIHECTTDAKHLQFVSGVKLVPYWLSSYVVDILIFFIVGAGIVTVFAAFDVVEYGRTSRLHLVAILIAGYSWAVLPEMYLLSRLFQSPASGLVWLTVINMLSAVIGFIIVVVLCHPAIHQQSLSYRFELLLMFLSPSFAVTDGIFMLFENFQFKHLCDDPAVGTICLLNPSFPCCLKTCTPFCAYWTAHDISFERGGIAYNLVAMATQCLVFNLLVFFLDTASARRLYLWIKSVQTVSFFGRGLSTAYLASAKSSQVMRRSSLTGKVPPWDLYVSYTIWFAIAVDYQFPDVLMTLTPVIVRKMKILEYMVKVLRFPQPPLRATSPSVPECLAGVFVASRPQRSCSILTFHVVYRSTHCCAWDRGLSQDSCEVLTTGLPPVQEDQDVVYHRHLVETTPIARLKEQACLILRNVSKCYGPVWAQEAAVPITPAVDRMSVAVIPSECFGLLGINGAGKTTTFRMITGDLDPTEGQIWVNGFESSEQPRQAQRSLGYCPQSDALLPYLTGRETLRLYGRLRGLREDAVNIEVDQLLHELRLNHYANVRVGHYSGGKKRKLSVAVALIGGPPVVCLDEPTTGVDPVSRRRVWNLLMRCRRQGRTIMLSSHSMEECEALCTRVCIVVNGQLKCLGTCQHLKARFGRGYSLTLQIVSSSLPDSPSHLTSTQGSSSSAATTTATTSDNDYADVKGMAILDELVKNAMHFVEQEFPEARLVDRHQGVVQYHLPTSSTSEGISLSKVFRLMESNRAALSIANYSLSQTTLEQIFIDLVKLQEEPKSTTLHSTTSPSAAAGTHCLVRRCLRGCWRHCHGAFNSCCHDRQAPGTHTRTDADGVDGDTDLLMSYGHL